MLRKKIKNILNKKGKIPIICLTAYSKNIAEEIETLLGTSFRLVASSAWYISSDCEDVGPSAEHTDGLPESFYKIMIYPSRLNEEDGTIMLRNADGHAEYVETDGPVWMLFDSNKVSHQGIRPKRSRYSSLFTSGNYFPFSRPGYLVRDTANKFQTTRVSMVSRI